MAFTVTNVSQAREMVEQLQNKAERAQQTMTKIREKAENAIGTGIRMAEVSGAAFAFGYANGRWGENGELTIAGLPVDLGAAVALHGVAFLGGLGKYTEHGHNLGSGALAATAYRTGAQIGAEAASRSLEAMALHASPQGTQPPWMLAPPAGAAAAQPTSVQSFIPSSPFGR